MPQDDDISIEDLLTARQRQHSRQTAPVTSAPTAGGSQVGGEMADDALKSNQPKEDTIHVIPKGYRLRGEKAPQDVNLNLTNTNLIVSSKRSRKLRDLNNFAVQVYAKRLGPEPLVDYLRAFSTEILCDRASASADKVPRIHQSQLPPLPKSENQLNTHMFGDQFRHAIEIEWRDLRAKGVFGHTEQSKATADSEILPLMWVFSYKTDGDRYLSRFKARLVVRGDLQAPIDDTYAATLAIRNFRALIAIANYFDLELKQYDVPTAFLNAKTNRKLYAETPKAFRHIKGEIMLVLRALYGLKEAPIL
ncbi:hypothetical protein PtrM4_144620 [Pyrenophora tritici-repentis]|uniref:Reverse transcriptase Ty1/copia-type domain-containing protein n=1 Tax=Pyrenophora tritici-repentis TaxID=45151 RepID=A0A834RMB8_9PLEO|nr:hypothetical protein PtrM4_144620 [Pyrenophora tritici-repentis]